MCKFDVVLVLIILGLILGGFIVGVSGIFNFPVEPLPISITKESNSRICKNSCCIEIYEKSIFTCSTDEEQNEFSTPIAQW